MRSLRLSRAHFTHLAPELLALAFRPLVVAAEVGADVVPAEELEGELVVAGAAEDELLLDSELAELAEEAPPLKQEASLLAWIGTWEE